MSNLHANNFKNRICLHNKCKFLLYYICQYLKHGGHPPFPLLGTGVFLIVINICFATSFQIHPLPQNLNVRKIIAFASDSDSFGCVGRPASVRSMLIRKWPIRWVTVIAVIGLLRTAVDGRLAPYVPEWPHRLTSAALAAYVNQTFGPHQRCLNVAFDDTAEAAAIVAMLYCHRLYRQPREWDSGAGGQSNHENGMIAAVTARTIELNESWDGPAALSCSAYVVVGRRLDVVISHLENFRNGASERMLVVVVQNRKYIKPFMKVSSSCTLLSRHGS